MTGDNEQHQDRNVAQANDAGAAAPGISQAEIASHLERLLASEGLAKAATNRRLLSYLAQRATDGAEGPKESQIAIDVFGRNVSFHGGDDSVVRVAMRSLRQKLVEYYAGPGKHDHLVFDIPKGSYRLQVSASRHPGGAPGCGSRPSRECCWSRW
jgi:DNA-binding response OmpR family regulator